MLSHVKGWRPHLDPAAAVSRATTLWPARAVPPVAKHGLRGHKLGVGRNGRKGGDQGTTNAQPVPEGSPTNQAAMIEPAAVALYGVDRGRVEGDRRSLSRARAPIGALTVLAAKAAGAATIIVSEPNPNRRRIISEIAPVRTRRRSPKWRYFADCSRYDEEGVGLGRGA